MKILLYISIVVILFSCKAKKTIETKETMQSSDSIVYIERTTIDTVKFPSDTIYRLFPITVFQTDTVIEYRNGRASSKIESNSGIIYVTTKCDSLQKLVLSTQTELKELTKVNHSKVLVKTKIKEIQWWYKASFWIVISLVVYWLGKTVFKIYLKPI